VRLVYLPRAAQDLLWFRHYYAQVFPEGAAGARERVLAVERLLLANPHLGRPTHRPDVRRLTIARTPFFLLYRLQDDRIEILRFIDGRSFDSLLDD
jgi:plasmid stabilization system protein ParE